MKKLPSFASQAWLLSGLINSLPGVLSIRDGKLVFTAIGMGTFGGRGLKKIETKSGAEDFASLLQQDKPAQLFEVELSEIQKVTFPAIYFSAGAHVTIRNEKYRLSFIQPNNTTISGVGRNDYGARFKGKVEIAKDISQSRKIGEKWKSILMG
jgi:hypothetical protein